MNDNCNHCGQSLKLKPGVSRMLWEFAAMIVGAIVLAAVLAYVFPWGKP